MAINPTATRMDDAPIRRLWRIVRTDPPTRADFLSNTARGRPLSADALPEAAGLWDGLSVYDTEGAARRKGRYSPMLGAFIAAVDVPLAARIEQTTTNPHHHTVWGDADELLQSVVYLVPVRRREEGK